jgi:Predicted membrane protein (DUF2142)
VKEPYETADAEGLLRSHEASAVTLPAPPREDPAPPVASSPRHSVPTGPGRQRPGLVVRRLTRRPARPLLRTWLVSFFVLFVAVAAWSFASPLGSGPDEPAHLVRAASLVRGQLVGQDLPHPTSAQKSTVVVKVPEVFASLETDISCFQFRPTAPAGCQRPLNGSTHTVSVETYVGRYPPLYYALVGLPTLVLVSVKGIYAARLVSGALSAAMLALAITSLRRCRGAPLLAAGLALAVTPMALYLAAIISPSGLEIASAISAWTAAMALASQRPGEVSASAVGALGVSISVLLLTRALAPLWVVFILAAFIGVGAATPLRDFLRRRSVQAWSAVCVLAGVFSLVWDLLANPFLTEPGSPLPARVTEGGIFELALARLDLLVTSSIGQFGWLDAPSPYLVIVLWLGALGAVVLIGACLARRRALAVVVGTVVAWVVVPTVMIMSTAHQEGILGQGRDFMGLAVGIPIVAAVVAGERFLDRRTTLRLAGVVVALVAVCQAVDFYAALRRFTVGTNGPLDAFSAVARGWHAPIPGVALVIVFTIAMVALALLLRRVAEAQPPLSVPRPGLSWPLVVAANGQPATGARALAEPAPAVLARRPSDDQV